jgi:hypothetical protein
LVYFWNRSCISCKETLHFSTSHIFISDKHVCISKQVTYYKEVFLPRSARHINAARHSDVSVQRCFTFRPRGRVRLQSICYFFSFNHFHISFVWDLILEGCPIFLRKIVIFQAQNSVMKQSIKSSDNALKVNS